ncbi:MAG: 1-acyl-sn-glycerol-3-phosphate acyltransferase [Bacteroidales bacterium]|nr:1-acyl-sn-glycerol-3-phosphate acyltransferase [Bacteroidales bacterium]
MRRFIARNILRLFGWKIIGSPPATEKKYIVIMAPHTSNWDFIIGWFGFAALGLHSKYLIKKEAFFFPLGGLVKMMGGIPVDRTNSRNVAVQISNLFREQESLIITITPEGTRRLNNNWKKGFYHIARHADIPIILGFLDYKTKQGGLGPLVYLTGDIDSDMKTIEQFYRDKTARFPEFFNLTPSK